MGDIDGTWFIAWDNTVLPSDKNLMMIQLNDS